MSYPISIDHLNIRTPQQLQTRAVLAIIRKRLFPDFGRAVLSLSQSA
jgi:hypothetical protein